MQVDMREESRLIASKVMTNCKFLISLKAKSYGGIFFWLCSANYEGPV